MGVTGPSFVLSLHTSTHPTSVYPTHIPPSPYHLIPLPFLRRRRGPSGHGTEGDEMR